MVQRQPAAGLGWIVAILAIAGTSVLVERGWSAEDGSAFLAALRERNMHDVALGYLQSRAASPLVDEEFRQQIPYEQGMTLIDQAQRTTDLSRRNELLEQAQEHLRAFAAANPESDLAGEARLQLAQVLLERGRQDVVRAERRAAGGAERDKLLESARATIDQARALFAEVQEHYADALKELPKNLDPRTEADKIERRDEYRLQWLTAWFYKARTTYEKAQTYANDSPDFKQLHEQAIGELAELYEKYGTRLVGLTAHLYQGRAYQAIGDVDSAIGCFESLVIQPDGAPEFRLLIAQAYTGLGECLLQQAKFDEVIERLEAWLHNSTSEEQRRPDWLAARYVVAQAKKQKADTLEEGSPAWNKLRREAREEFKLIAREPSPLRQDARREFASLTSRASDERAAAEIKTFDEAFQSARDAFDEMQGLAARAATEEDADSAADLEDAVAASRQRAKAYFQRALALANSAESVEVEDLHLARYYLGWLHFQDEEYFRAAVLGDFLARRYPDALAARDAAKLAMLAYQQLYRTAKDEGASDSELDFEAERLASIAEFVVRRWTGSEDAALAQDTLVSFAVREGRIDDAKAMLEGVDPQRRLQSELRVANGLWVEFLHARSRQEAGSQSAEELARLRDEAAKWLEAGFRSAAEADEISALTATTGLYLAQAHLLADDYAQAVAVLEAEKVGPLTLARANHPAVQQREFFIEVTKVAAQAFALGSPPQPEKVQSALEALEQALAATGDGAAQLTQIYLGLGLQLRERLETLNATGKEEEARRVAAAFAGLLDRLMETAGANDWNTQLWTAHTLYEVGEALASSETGSAVAKTYFEKSLAAYDKLLKTAEAQAGFAPSERAALAVRKRKADVLRGMGRFKEAVDMYSAILAENVMMLDVQRDAAMAYQLWGEQDPRRFENAIFGGRRVKSTGENRIWGWIKLSKVAAQAARQNSQYRDWYFEARLNAAKARYRAALAVNDDNGQKAQLYKAKNAIRALYQIYPDLGGSDRQREFNELLLQIQHKLEERQAGLQEFAGSR